MSGLILLPTLNRIELLKDFIKSYVETKATVETWILVDQDDMAKNPYSELTLPPQIKLLDSKTNVSMGDKVRWAYAQMPENCTWVGLLNDDHYCITLKWDKRVEELIDGTNMVSTNDGFWNFGFRVVGLTAWSTNLIKTVGFPIFPDGIEHLYIDDVWKAIGESTGCWQETLSINIEHRHVLCGKQAEDETFRKVNSQKDYESGLKVFQKFMETDFKDVCRRVLEFRNTHTFKNKFI